MRRIETGSKPYDDGSGYTHEIVISEDAGGGATIWLGYRKAMAVDPEDWPQLKADVDAALAAYNALPPAPKRPVEDAKREAANDQ